MEVPCNANLPTLKGCATILLRTWLHFYLVNSLILIDVSMIRLYVGKDLFIDRDEIALDSYCIFYENTIKM